MNKLKWIIVSVFVGHALVGTAQPVSQFCQVVCRTDGLLPSGQLSDVATGRVSIPVELAEQNLTLASAMSAANAVAAGGFSCDCPNW